VITAPAIVVEDTVFTYAKTGWQFGPVSLAIQGGKMTGLIGPNGSGKSTFLSILSRRMHGRGHMTLLGRAARSFSAREWAQTVAYLPQQIVIEYDFSVEETAAFGRFPHSGMTGFLTHHDRDVIERCLEETEMAGLRGRLLSELSGGERQRAHLAAVLAQEPRVLFLDEPTTALDIHHQIAFHSVLRGCADNGITVVLATHDLTLAAQFCDELVLVAGGTVKRSGPPTEVITQDVIQDVYGANVSVITHPQSGKPVVVANR